MNNIANKVATLVLAGGQGTRLFPLTQSRCKPAVHFAGRYRLIDIPISCALNSKFHNIYILSQYLASGLNNHVTSTYHFDRLQGGHLECLTPEESDNHKVWFKGTADAVRKNINYLSTQDYEYFLILSGDQLYNMDLNHFVDFGLKRNADLTIATLPIEKRQASRFGLMKIDSNHNITDFIEKPQDPNVLRHYKLDPSELKHKSDKAHYLASMGIYFFKRDALFKLLEEDDREDFGKHLIPNQIRKGSSYAYIYEGYWEDIGTIESYFNANLGLTRGHIDLNFYSEHQPIHAHTTNLPAPRLTNARISDSIICDGCIIKAKEITHSLIGLRSKIGENTIIRNSILIGNEFYRPPENSQLPEQFTIGSDCHIENAIIDAHAHIGNNVTLTNKENLQTYDSDLLYIRDGIIVIPSGATIPDSFHK
ncbi:MAG: sugar phosphate nucleotidyltransferase [Candidatus Algichlamydia australiensis]|nr:sugar phosphate nucleotidyltransferase [Chlamydiales bacterium]